MRFDPAQLETLLAIAEEGSFEGAARRLRLTPSAVSQRIRALEAAAGQVLIRRTLPAEVTDAGTPLLWLAQQLRLLSAETGAALGDDDTVELSVAVNADSLATWFRAVFTEVAVRPGTALRISVEDEGHSHELLRRGEVLAAVTAEPKPVQGCSVEHLGVMRYQAAVAPALLQRHKRGSRIDWASIPMIVVNEKDLLQDTVLTARGTARPRVVHRVPSSADFLAAVCAGLGWGLVPASQFKPTHARGDLARMPGAGPVDVELFWQRWRLQSPALDTLTAGVRTAARMALRPPAMHRIP
jgi:LysR family transcriptional regulator (chromosome initiation inhibitor)